MLYIEFDSDVKVFAGFETFSEEINFVQKILVIGDDKCVLSNLSWDNLT